MATIREKAEDKAKKKEKQAKNKQKINKKKEQRAVMQCFPPLPGNASKVRTMMKGHDIQEK